MLRHRIALFLSARSLPVWPLSLSLSIRHLHLPSHRPAPPSLLARPLLLPSPLSPLSPLSRYADNILKGFATSLAICITATVSVMMGDIPFSYELLGGCAIVIGAIGIYGGGCNDFDIDLSRRSSLASTTAGITVQCGVVHIALPAPSC